MCIAGKLETHIWSVLVPNIIYDNITLPSCQIILIKVLKLGLGLGIGQLGLKMTQTNLISMTQFTKK
jgi:hypothetical protein